MPRHARGTQSRPRARRKQARQTQELQPAPPTRQHTPAADSQQQSPLSEADEGSTQAPESDTQTFPGDDPQSPDPATREVLYTPPVPRHAPAAGSSAQQTLSQPTPPPTNMARTDSTQSQTSETMTAAEGLKRSNHPCRDAVARTFPRIPALDAEDIGLLFQQTPSADVSPPGSSHQEATTARLRHSLLTKYTRHYQRLNRSTATPESDKRWKLDQYGDDWERPQREAFEGVRPVLRKIVSRWVHNPYDERTISPFQDLQLNDTAPAGPHIQQVLDEIRARFTRLEDDDILLVAKYFHPDRSANMFTAEAAVIQYAMEEYTDYWMVHAKLREINGRPSAVSRFRVMGFTTKNYILGHVGSVAKVVLSKWLPAKMGEERKSVIWRRHGLVATEFKPAALLALARFDAEMQLEEADEQAARRSSIGPGRAAGPVATASRSQGED